MSNRLKSMVVVYGIMSVANPVASPEEHHAPVPVVFIRVILNYRKTG